MDPIAQTYVHLVLAVGLHDPYYVDAYYGPAEWKAQVEAEKPPLLEIRKRAIEAIAELDGLAVSEADALSELRRQSLTKQLQALVARVDIVSGVEMPFDQESAALYDVVDGGHPDSFYEEVLDGLETRLPGEGSLGERYERFRSQFYIPTDKLDAVFSAAIEAARQRTKEYVDLSADENFRLEYVTGEVWSAYNWYQGNAHSLIQLNTDFPLSIDRALHLACHEGYPGHHVYNALLETHLMRGRNWVEFSVYPLYSPQSLIAEGTAEYGVELSFPAAERLAFERETLFPLAGLDSGQAEAFAEVRALMGRLTYASNDSARRYLDGKASRQETIDWLVHYTLSTPDRADQRVRFFEQHRSYVVTYNLGEDLVRSYVEQRAESVEDRWKVFAELLCTPRVPSSLK